MHGVTGPDDIRALFLHGLDQTWQVFPHIAGPETRDQGQATLFVFRVQLVHQQLEVIAGHRRAALQADGVLNAAGKFHMRAIRLTCPVTDPDHVTRARQPFAGLAVLTAQCLFVFQQQRFVACIIFHRLQGMCRFGRDASRRHEIKRV